MVKVSEKHIKKEIIVFIIAIILILTNLVFILWQNFNKNKEEALPKYEYKAFVPTFQNNYDFTQDMAYSNKIYYKKINSYDEYSKIKERWNNIIEMSEEDFQENFMMITAIENVSMEGLTVNKIEADSKTLYISLIHYEDGVNYDENETCISYKISRELERENISVTRNFRENEKV